MSTYENTQERILSKLKISALNTMQNEFIRVYSSSNDIVLLSPTGSGKTLAFLLPLVQDLKSSISALQALILVPSRELAIQIEQVLRNMATGYKINAFYGGRPLSQDKLDLKQVPSILIGTPGRIADHFRRGTFSIDQIQTLVLDEFDKSLEIGFAEEMSEIIKALTLKRKILTSATNKLEIPNYVDLQEAKWLDFLDQGIPKLEVQLILSPDKDKLESLGLLVDHLHPRRGIIFCNFKDSISRVSSYLKHKDVQHGYFHGGLDQIQRETSLTKFRNGTYTLLLATDLAARGLDIPEIDFIIHYHLPLKEEEFTHRNGRTARMHREGVAYLLHWKKETLPSFIKISNKDTRSIGDLAIQNKKSLATEWRTLMISAGRKDKISKGDIAGFVLRQAGLKKEEVGLIEVKRNVSFVAIQKDQISAAIKSLDKNKIKKKKVKVGVV